MAYRYLSGSVFEFGTGEEFEHELASTGFGVVQHQAYMFGAARLWTAQRLAAGPGGALRNARTGAHGPGYFAQASHPREQEWRWGTSARALVSAILSGSLVWALFTWVKWRPILHLEPWQDRIFWGLILAGLAGFSVRTLALVLRLLGPPPPG